MEHQENNKNNMTLEEEMHHQAKYQKKNMLWTVVILVAAFLLFSKGNSDLNINPGKEDIAITTPSAELVIAHDEIISYALVDGPNYGECLDGEQEGDVLYGTWKNEAWGEYQLAVESDLTRVVVLNRDEGTVVVNFISDDETGVLYDYIKACCPEAEDLS